MQQLQRPLSYWRNKRTYYGIGYANISKSIIEDVHRLVNEHRYDNGLEPIEFKDRMTGENMSGEIDFMRVDVGRSENWPQPPEPTYKADEINLALSKGGSIRVTIKAGDTKVKCACNCGGYLPVATAMQGWKYLHGHKTPDSLNKNGQLRNGSSHAKPVVRSEVYDTFISRIKMDKANVEHEMKTINEEATRLLAKLKGLKEEYIKLDAAEKALIVFLPEKTQAVGA